MVGRGFTKRDDEHLKEAKKNTPSSKFYRGRREWHSGKVLVAQKVTLNIFVNLFLLDLTLMLSNFNT